MTDVCLSGSAVVAITGLLGCLAGAIGILFRHLQASYNSATTRMDARILQLETAHQAELAQVRADCARELAQVRSDVDHRVADIARDRDYLRGLLEQLVPAMRRNVQVTERAVDAIERSGKDGGRR